MPALTTLTSPPVLFMVLPFVAWFVLGVWFRK
jgi:hypothetical protein